MATKKKLLQAAAGQAGGAALNVEDVFSTYLYEGNAAGQGATAQSITNNIDLSGEGGLVWIKNRDSGGTSAWSHYLFDTERGATKYVRTNVTNGEGTSNNSLSAFNSDGFTLGETGGTNNNGDSYASWTFRKAPKFFDVVTYTGDGTAGRTVSHNLGSVPGCIIVKKTNSTSNWIVYHRANTAAPETDRLKLNSTEATTDDNTSWNDTAPTSTEFTVGTNGAVNGNGDTFVAYLFAHNNGDGEFGPDADADIIKCGSYTGNGSTDGPEIDLGFEPQFVIVKNATAVSDWRIFDTMRGWHVANGSNDQLLSANLTSAESGGGFSAPNATGFKIDSTGSNYNTSGQTYIYIAIRRGPMAVPESATDVFGIETYTGNASTQEITTDMTDSPSFVGDAFFAKSRDFATDGVMTSRLTGQKGLYTSSTGAEGNEDMDFFNRNSVNLRYQSGNMNYNTKTYVSYLWSRAPNFCDVVAYTGNGTAGRTVSHNLGVAPEMMWVKSRDDAYPWPVYHKDLTSANKYLNLNANDPEAGSTNRWNDTAPTASVFTLGNGTNTNKSGSDFIAYLFASLNGVSKVGSFTHTSGSATNVDCGFSSGARFVIYKKSSATGSWYVFDTERGIVSGNDPFLFLDTTDAEYTIYDVIDPLSSGFTAAPGLSSGSYIFYAIA